MPPQRTAAQRARFEGVFERHQRAVHAYALRRARSTADAEDAVAETFLTAWRRLDDVPADPLPWLYGVARRVLANQHRSSGRRAKLLDRLRRQPDPGFPAPAGDPRAVRALDGLSVDDQELLRLVAWEELSHGEIATVMGITPNAVAIRLHRARQRFAAAYAALVDDGVKGFAGTRTHGSRKGKPDQSWRHKSAQ